MSEQAEAQVASRPMIEVQWQDVERRSQLFWELPQAIFIFTIFCVALWLDPGNRLHGTHMQLGLPPCACLVMFGFPCPSCGLTTCFSLMAHGRFLRAFQAHYFGPFLFLGMMSYFVLQVVSLIRKQRIKIIWPTWIPLTLLLTGLALYLICWLIRVIQYI